MLRLASLTAVAVLAFAGVTQAAQPAPRRNTCVECHDEVEKQLEMDVHKGSGFSCVDCHRGDASSEDPERAMDPRRGFIGKPQGFAVARLCGGCHADIERMRAVNPRLPTDQLAQYRTSEHGKLALKGDAAVATCVSCHGSHGVRKVQDPASTAGKGKIVETCTGCHNAAYMKGRAIATDQLEKYKLSAHGHKRLKESDPGAPACSDCHGSHGAAPPGVAAVTHVCGKCHATQAELFEASSHAGHFKEAGVPPCTTCHNHHDILATGDEMFGTEPGSTCSACHQKGDACDKATGSMKQSLVGLTASAERAKAALERAERLGMDVEKATYELAGAGEAIVRARVAIHRFSEPEFQKIIADGIAIAGDAERAGQAKLAEYRSRRQGLAVAAVALLMFAGLLALRASSIEKARLR
jgi:hypothetical protein